MRNRLSVWLGTFGTALLLSNAASGQQLQTAAVMPTLQCESSAGQRHTCPANTAAGVALLRSTGTASCLLGNNWGYDQDGVWVANGCSGEFGLGLTEAAIATDAAAPAPSASDPTAYETWGFYDPGRGFLVGQNDAGSLSLSAYALVRYLDQGGNESFIDHNGNAQGVDLRRDIYSHRVLVFLAGWIGKPQLVYNIAFWTVNTTDQDALFGNIGYRFSKKFNLYAGIFGNPGSRSLQGSHPYWLGNDRVMADEFFRPFFSQGIWANGEILPGLWYGATIGNTSSILGVKANQIDREFTTGGSLWWMPTTKEFGPRGAYGDWEMHEKVATRFGISYTNSPEERYTSIGTDPGNTALKLTDSLNLFATGSLAPNVTITKADYEIVAVDAGMKYRGMFLQAEYYYRTLDNFQADGALPLAKIVDTGYYVQAAFYPIPKKLELYAATSQVFGDNDASIGDAHEYLVGMNYYPADTRNHRLNLQVIDVTRSPVSSTFGYYTGGQSGTTVAAAFSVFF